MAMIMPSMSMLVKTIVTMEQLFQGQALHMTVCQGVVITALTHASVGVATDI